MRLTAEGNVGIGTASPQAKLEVTGTVSSTGISVTGVISATSMYANGVLLSMPIGVILPWHKSKSGTPSLPDGWLECNGQTVSDAASPYNGTTVPNLNSQVYAGSRGYYLRGGNASGAFNGSTYMTGNSNLYDFHDSGANYYGIAYGYFYNTENGSASTYSSSDNDFGGPHEFMVAAMTVVYIIKIK